MLTENKYPKSLEWIMINSSINISIVIVLCSTNYKIDINNEFDA